MDQLKHQKMVATLTQSLKSHQNLFKLTQLLVSLSVFSFMFSPSSLLVFLHYFKFYFSTFPFQLFTHNIDKNCMFLLCNGLLVFVGITRSFSGSSGDAKPSKYAEDDSLSQFPDVDENEPLLEEEPKEKTSEHDEQNVAEEHTIDIKYYAEEVDENVEKIILVDEEEEEEEEGSAQSFWEEEEEEEAEVDKETELFDEGDDEEEYKRSEIDYFLSEEYIEEEEEEQEEEEESTEELNKKFDDFIRRVKEDLRIEAKRQLVMV